MTNSFSTAARVLIGAALCVACSGVMAQTMWACGDLQNHFGPFDYASPIDAAQLPKVERFHFNRDVQQLKRGQTAALPLDIDYTLRAFPNHYLALDAMARYQLKNPRPAGARYYSADCYFQRAMLFRPEDATVRMLYGSFLFRQGDSDGALSRYQEALQLAPESAEVHYNLGLLYVDREELQSASRHAVRAYELGYPLPGLRNMLKRQGAWPAAPESGGSP